MSFVTSSSSRSILDPNQGFTAPVSSSTFARAASTAALYALNRYGPSVVGAAQTRMDSVVNSMNERISGSGSGSGNNSNSNSSQPPTPSPNKGGRRPRRNVPGVGGSPDVPGVAQITLDSGIISGILDDPFQSTTDYYSPLFIQCGGLFSTEGKQKDSDMVQLLSGSLYFKYVTEAQKVINSNIGDRFTQDKFYEYVGNISYALELYYMIDSILAYTSYNNNKNIAMQHLRMAITPDISNGHIQLRNILESMPIPPRLLEYIRYMYQNFSFNNVSGSPIIRLSLNDSLCTSEYDKKLGVDLLTYDNIITKLINQSDISSIIAKFRSSWIVKLPPSSYEAFYDPQFSTFWHNSNVAYEDYGSQIIKYSINVKSDTDEVYYGVFDNRLDGVIYASCSINDQNSIIQKGIWKPYDKFSDNKSINTSLLHYSNDSLIRPVTDKAFRVSSMVASCPYTEITKDNNPIWVNETFSYAGCYIPQIHNLRNLTQAVSRTVDWLLNLN